MKNIVALIVAITALAALAGAAAFVCERIGECCAEKSNSCHRPYGIYERFFKRPLDCFLSMGALIALSPVLIALTVVGAIQMQGNPFFTQERPGKDERIFKLIKFRTMNNKRDKNGDLLPDAQRLTGYGRWLRSTSLDELPELLNIIKGDMSIIGPRPLLVRYLDRYSAEQRRRHEVRPGLTGLAQVSGRNALTWEDKFRYDVEYVDAVTLWGDIRIVFRTVRSVLKHDGISSGTSATMEEFMGSQKEA